MNSWFKVFDSRMLALATFVSLLGCQSCSAQAVFKNEEKATSAPPETGVIAQSAVGAVKTGVSYPEKTKSVREPKTKNELVRGAPSAAELAAIKRIKLPPAFNPREAIGCYVDKLAPNTGPPFLQMARLQFLEHAALSSAISDSSFYSLRFPQWPIGYAVPEPLRNNNIFAFDSTAKLVLITQNDQLEKLMRERLHGVKDDQSARAAITAYLLLAEEIAQDGMYQFAIPESEIKVQKSDAGITVSGKAVVNPTGGNAGEITATLICNPKGHFVSAHQSVNLQAGMRPICQSTKLLDPDPLVRRMAEQDILIMGSAAKPYLDEQRKKLSPELQKAIDRIWQRIQAEGR